MRGLLGRILVGLLKRARGFSFLRLPFRSLSVRAPLSQSCFHSHQYLCSIANAIVKGPGRDGCLGPMRLRSFCRHWHFLWRSISQGSGLCRLLLVETSFSSCVFKWVVMRWWLADVAYSSWKDYRPEGSLSQFWGLHDCLKSWSGCSHWYSFVNLLSGRTYLTWAPYDLSWLLLITVRWTSEILGSYRCVCS